MDVLLTGGKKGIIITNKQKYAQIPEDAILIYLQQLESTPSAITDGFGLLNIRISALAFQPVMRTNSQVKSSQVALLRS